MKKIIFFNVLLLLFVACTDSTPKYDSRIVNAYKLLIPDTDSAFCLLSKMNINDFSNKHDRAYYAYAYTVTLYWLDTHATSDTLIREAIDYYSVHGDSVMKSKVYYYAAKVYESMKDRQRAVSYFNKALESAPSDSIAMKLYVYADWAFMINGDRPDNESYDLYEKVKDYAIKADSKGHYIDALIQQGWIHLVNQEYNKAIVKYKEADDLAVKNNFNFYRFHPLNRLACCYMREGNMEKALFYAQKAEKLVKSLPEKKNINRTFADIYTRIGEFDKAEEYIKLSADTTNTRGLSIYYLQLWDLYVAKGDYKRACEYGKKHIDYRDLDYIALLKNNAAEFQAIYDKTELEYQKAEVDEKERQMKMLVVIGSLALVIVVVSLILVVYVRRVKMMTMLKTKDDTMADLSLSLQSKINELQDLRTQLIENADELEKTRRQRQELKLCIFEMNEVVKKINDFKKVKNSDVVGRGHVLTDVELDVLSEMTDFLHNDIMVKLRARYPRLTKSDLHLCCLLSLGLSGTKIALLLDTSDDALKKRKSRLIRTKLGVTDSNETLDEYLERLKSE